VELQEITGIGWKLQSGPTSLFNRVVLVMAKLAIDAAGMPGAPMDAVVTTYTVPPLVVM
jgi:hypothetical protein